MRTETLRLTEAKPLGSRAGCSAGIFLRNNRPRKTNHGLILLDFAGRPKVSTWLIGSANHDHSNRKLSTGSSFAARAAGTVPNRMPTIAETTIATIAESPEIGIRYAVRKRTE